jgi:hypothetical protein
MTLTQITKAGLDNIALDHVFTIGASGTDHYTFQGEGLNGTVNDPTLYLTRGKTYRFENGTGAHPIRIQSTSGASGTAYNTGVTNNAGSGTVIVEVQHDAPDVLYYQCTSHANMNGILYITGALADGGVTTAKLAADAVDGTKIAAGAVTTAKIANGTIQSEDIADNQIITTKILDTAVTLAKLPHGTVSNDGKFLRANNGADPSFETVSIPAGTTINNNADNRVITGSGTANTLEGEATFTHNPSTYDTTIIHNANSPSDLIVQNDSSGTAANARLTLQSGSNANAGAMLSLITGSDNWTLLTPKNAGALDFNDNGTLAFKMAGNGNFDVITGDVTINGSGKGIDFAQGANTGTAANILDDYEEGTFTPYPVNGWGILYGSATTAGAAADVAQGKYVKIGATVYVFFTFKEGNSSGASFQGTKILFYGMPFQSEGQYGTGSDVEAHPLNGFGNSLGSNGIGLFFRPDSSGSTVGGCHYQTSSGQADFTGQHLTNTGQIWFHGTYKVHP